MDAGERQWQAAQLGNYSKMTRWGQTVYVMTELLSTKSVDKYVDETDL